LPATAQKTADVTTRPTTTGIYFDDSRPDLLILGNATWEVAFRKTNGSVVYITDKSVGGAALNWLAS
jgi:hypothetical protein